MSNKEVWYPSVGDSFTISANKRTGDRSYTSKIWKCKCLNDIHVVFEHPEYGLILLVKSEHDFAPMECSAKSVKKEEPKWEPKGGKWTVSASGNIGHAASSSLWRKHGSECATEDQAEILRDMTRRNNLIFQAKCEIGAKDGRYEIFYVADQNKWVVSGIYYGSNPELTFDTEEHAEQVIKMLRLNEED